MDRGVIEETVASVGQSVWDQFPWLSLLVPVVCILGLIAVSALLLIWLERKISGDIQCRIGTLHHGPVGL